jgi:hypothetical protein
MGWAPIALDRQPLPKALATGARHLTDDSRFHLLDGIE